MDFSLHWVCKLESAMVSIPESSNSLFLIDMTGNGCISRPRKAWPLAAPWARQSFSVSIRVRITDLPDCKLLKSQEV